MLVACHGFTAPVEIDTQDFKVFVVRPLDQWAPDEITDPNNKVLSKFSEKDYSYSLYSTGSDYTTQKTDDAIALAIKEYAEGLGWKPNLSWAERMPNNQAKIGVAAKLTLKVAKNFFQMQQAYWDNGVLAQGNPSTIASRLKEKRDNSGLFALATTIAGMAVGGKFLGPSGVSSGFQATMDSGISSEVENLAAPLKTSMAYVQPPKIELSNSNLVDIRSVTLNSNRSGQIIIAYKTNKTPENEMAALRVAIPLVLSMDESVEQLMQARQADFSARQALWNACFAKGECKNEQ